jgi:anti-anti-sigma factor
MSTETTITVENRLSELERLGRGVETFAQRAGLSPQATFELSLAVDEVVTNIISYAYGDGDAHEIVVRLAVESGDVVVEIEDDGRPFDPLAVPAPRVDLPPAARPVGGLGMHLVRKVTDAVHYERRQERNRLVMRKQIAAAGAATPRTEHAMEITETKTMDVVVLAPAGRLDANNAPALAERLRTAIEAGSRKIVVDAARIDFIGSAGLQALLVAAKRLSAAGGEIVLAATTDAVRQVCEIAGLASVFQFSSSVADAVAAMAKNS